MKAKKQKNLANVLARPSEKLIQRIITDNDFSLDIAKILKIKQLAVMQGAKRKSQKLLLPDLIDFYKQHGFTAQEVKQYY